MNIKWIEEKKVRSLLYQTPAMVLLWSLDIAVPDFTMNIKRIREKNVGYGHTL